MSWEGPEAHAEKKRTAYRILLGKLERMKPLVMVQA